VAFTAGEGVLQNPAKRKAFIEELELWSLTKKKKDFCFE
jgi:hypothetical protein